MTALAKWQNFYVIMGSSAGALIGLQFVVLSFITGVRSARVDPQAAGAFATPTNVHFGVVLGLAGIFCVPWDGIGAASALCSLVGAAGLIYTIIIIRRIRT